MATYMTRVIFEDEKTGTGIVHVTTSRCTYIVHVDGDEIDVGGPGVDETFEDIPRDWGISAKALTAVIRFEEEA